MWDVFTRRGEQGIDDGRPWPSVPKFSTAPPSGCQDGGRARTHRRRVSYGAVDAVCRLVSHVKPAAWGEPGRRAGGPAARGARTRLPVAAARVADAAAAAANARWRPPPPPPPPALVAYAAAAALLVLARVSVLVSWGCWWGGRSPRSSSAWRSVLDCGRRRGLRAAFTWCGGRRQAPAKKESPTVLPTPCLFAAPAAVNAVGW